MKKKIPTSSHKRSTIAHKREQKKKRKFNAANMWKANFKKVSFETVIKPLYRKIIEPCLKHITLTEDQTLRTHGLRIWFDTANRSIGCYKVKRLFRLPGNVRDEDTGKFYKPSISEAELRKDDQLWVRFNDLKPLYVEVEVDHTGQIFFINTVEWESKVNPYVELIG